MLKKYYIVALVALLLVPAVTILSGVLINSIDPEIAVGHANYERNYRLLTLAKSVCILASFLVVVCLWFLTCFFLIKSKQRSAAWLSLGVLGPFGLIILTMLGDNSAVPNNLYQEFIGKLKTYLRVAYEVGFFVLVWVSAYQVMVWKRDLMIIYESARTGVSRTQIIDVQNASSGMWAFGEGLEVMFVIALFYLLWPICFNFVGRLPRACRWKNA